MGQFARHMQAHHPDGSQAGCEACHALKSWKNLAGFSHSSTSFRLEGGHAELACERCHRPDNFEAGIRNVVFGAAPKDCAGCHDDLHGGQFAKPNQPVDCLRCHTAKRWRPALFEHDRDSSYALMGAHRDVPCNLCHTQFEEMKGQRVRLYRSIPRTCIACHEPEVAPLKPPVKDSKTTRLEQKEHKGNSGPVSEAIPLKEEFSGKSQADDSESGTHFNQCAFNQFWQNENSSKGPSF